MHIVLVLRTPEVTISLLMVLILLLHSRSTVFLMLFARGLCAAGPAIIYCAAVAAVLRSNALAWERSARRHDYFPLLGRRNFHHPAPSTLFLDQTCLRAPMCP